MFIADAFIPSSIWFREQGQTSLGQLKVKVLVQGPNSEISLLTQRFGPATWSQTQRPKSESRTQAWFLI